MAKTIKASTLKIKRIDCDTHAWVKLPALRPFKDEPNKQDLQIALEKYLKLRVSKEDYDYMCHKLPYRFKNFAELLFENKKMTLKEIQHEFLKIHALSFGKYYGFWNSFKNSF